jgi:hypothetical protein
MANIPYCMKCGKTVRDDIYLTRANPKGKKPAIWICNICSGERDPFLEAIKNGLKKENLTPKG